MAVKREEHETTGIRLLIEHYREMFRIPENVNHYSEEDYMNAERHFIKIALNGGIPIGR